MTSNHEGWASLEAGHSASTTHAVRDADVALFALITGDQHPLHLDQHYAATTFFGQRIAPTGLITGIIEAALVATLPGMQGLVRCQSLEYPAPLYVDDELTVTIVLRCIDRDHAQVTCSITATNQAGAIVAVGDAALTIVDLPPLPEEI